MTKQAFADLYRVENRKLTRRMAVWVIISWGITLALIFNIRPILDYVSGLDWIGSLKPYVFWGFAGFLTLGLAFAVRSISYKNGVPCPKCGRLLFAGSAQIAVFSGNCGFCGAVVVEDSIVALAKKRREN